MRRSSVAMQRGCSAGLRHVRSWHNMLFLFPFPEASPLPAVHPKDSGARWGALRKDPVPPCDSSSDAGSFFGVSIYPHSKASDALKK